MMLSSFIPDFKVAKVAFFKILMLVLFFCLLIAFGNKTRCGHFAFLSSGSIRDVAGVSRSKVSVAVNKVHGAPISDLAVYGLVGDANQFLPKLIDATKKLKAE